jgi:YegS/Rv2252/BmrU family lipid kinase
MTWNDPDEVLIILNPASGGGKRADAIRSRAEISGFQLEQSDEAGDAIRIARDAAGSVSTIVAAGGDGTVNEVIQGIDQANSFDGGTLGVLPAGTGNNFAANIGITDIDTGFAALRDGPRRKIDLGRADGRPFVNSCIAGLTAESSSNTSRELKDRLGVLAYVVTTLRTVSNFESLRLTVQIEEGATATTAFAGEALGVLVGNGRRFAPSGGGQADMEDGLLDVTIIEDVSTLDLMSQTLIDQLLQRDSPHLVRSQTPDLSIRIHNPETIRFSLDGEIVKKRQLTIEVRPNILSLVVGPTYDPSPD